MSESKHTPGPLEVILVNHRAEGVRSKDGFVCFIPKPDRYAGQEERYESEKAERLANAYLYAAAPDLLDACTFAEGIIRIRNDANLPITKGDISAAKMLRAAIAKVKGDVV